MGEDLGEKLEEAEGTYDVHVCVVSDVPEHTV
jgi:hypothetical protein